MPYPCPSENKYDQRIKAPLVIGQQFVQESGDVTVRAPAGVVMDPSTGRLEPPVTLSMVGVPQLRVVEIPQWRLSIKSCRRISSTNA